MMYENSKKVLEKMRGVSKTAKTNVAKSIVKGMENSMSERCRLGYMVFNESLDLYKSGQMKWEEMVKELADTLLSIPDSKIEEEDEEEEDD